MLRAQGAWQKAGLAGLAVLGALCMTTKENSGLTFLLCAAALTVHFALQRERQAAILRAASAGFAILAYAAALAFLFGGFTHRYSFRYTASIFGPICLLAGYGAEALLGKLYRLFVPLSRPAAWVIHGFAISVAALRDFNAAGANFLDLGTQDLALRPIAGVPPAPVPPEYPR